MGLLLGRLRLQAFSLSKCGAIAPLFLLQKNFKKKKNSFEKGLTMYISWCILRSDKRGGHRP